nr:hypothetical protein CFP56_19446 [Quercus suber]
MRHLTFMTHKKRPLGLFSPNEVVLVVDDGDTVQDDCALADIDGEDPGCMAPPNLKSIIQPTRSALDSVLQVPASSFGLRCDAVELRILDSSVAAMVAGLMNHIFTYAFCSAIAHGFGPERAPYLGACVLSWNIADQIWPITKFPL